MDVQGFIDHLDRHRQEGGGDPFMLHTAKIHISNIAKIECALGNLIRKRMDGRRRIHASLAPTEANNDPNQVLMGWDAHTPGGTISAVRDSIKNYCEFLGDNVEDF